MAKLAVIFAFLFSTALVAQAASGANSVGHVDRQLTCSTICFTLRGAEERAEIDCRRRGPGCAVIPCERSGRTGFTCGVAPTPTPSPSQIPISEGPIMVPTILQFPPEIEIGGTINVTIEVTVDDVSSSTMEDFYLLSDATGSMAEEIREVQENFDMLVDARRNASGDVAFGVGFYRDEEDIPPFENLQSLTTNLGLVDTAIASLNAVDGGDIPEANLFAISEVATNPSIGWRDGSRKILVYFGDAPGHEPTCPADSVPLTRDVVVDQLNEIGIAVVATNFAASNTEGLNAATTSANGANFGCPGPVVNSPSGQADAITSGTLGSIRRIADSGSLIDQILDAVTALPQELSVSTTDCDGRVAITFRPDLPLLIAAGETRSIVEEATILPGACEFPDGFTCEINLNLSGVGVRQTIATTSIAGCVPGDGFP